MNMYFQEAQFSEEESFKNGARKTGYPQPKKKKWGTSIHIPHSMQKLTQNES